MSTTADVAAVHPDDGADRHDEGEHGTDEGPWARIDEMVVVVLCVGVSHLLYSSVRDAAKSAGASETPWACRRDRTCRTSVISLMPCASGSSIMAGSTKNTTGISTLSPGFNVCSVKQKHWILLKYARLHRCHVEDGTSRDAWRNCWWPGSRPCSVRRASLPSVSGRGGSPSPDGRRCWHQSARPQCSVSWLRAARLGALRGATKAGHLAEQPVERNGCIGQAHHAHRDARGQRCHAKVLLRIGSLHQNALSVTPLPRRTMVVTKNSTTRAKRISAMTSARFLRRDMSSGPNGVFVMASFIREPEQRQEGPARVQQGSAQTPGRARGWKNQRASCMRSRPRHPRGGGRPAPHGR